MSYKLAAIKTLSAAAIMYATVMAIYSGYVWPAVYLSPVRATASRSGSLAQQTQPTQQTQPPLAIAPRQPTPDLFISPQQERAQSPAEIGIKRSGSAVQKEEDAKLAQVKEVRSGSQLGRVKTEVHTTTPGAVLSQSTHQLIKEETKEKGFGNTRDGLN